MTELVKRDPLPMEGHLWDVNYTERLWSGQMSYDALKTALKRLGQPWLPLTIDQYGYRKWSGRVALTDGGGVLLTQDYDFLKYITRPSTPWPDALEKHWDTREKELKWWEARAIDACPNSACSLRNSTTSA